MQWIVDLTGENQRYTTPRIPPHLDEELQEITTTEGGRISLPQRWTPKWLFNTKWSALKHPHKQQWTYSAGCFYMHNNNKETHNGNKERDHEIEREEDIKDWREGEWYILIKFFK